MSTHSTSPATSVDLPATCLPRQVAADTAGPADHTGSHPGAFRPLSRDDVATVLGISIRTLENWVRQGTLPAPVSIGGRRYWHPERFYAALNAMLMTGGSRSEPVVEPKAPQPAKLPASKAGKRAKATSQDATQEMLRQAMAAAGLQQAA